MDSFLFCFCLLRFLVIFRGKFISLDTLHYPPRLPRKPATNDSKSLSAFSSWFFFEIEFFLAVFFDRFPILLAFFSGR